MGNPVYVPCHELPEEVERVECSIDDVGEKICDAGYLIEKEFICGTVDDMPFLSGGIAIAPKAVNVIHATVDQNKKDMRMLVQRQHVNFIRGKRPISEGSSSESLISFSDADLEGVDLPHNDPLVISLNVRGHLVDRILVDPGSAVDIMYINLFSMLKLKLEDLKKTRTVLSGFNHSSMKPMGVARLPIYLEPKIVMTEFLVIDVDSTHNAIVGRPWIHKTRAVPSTLHQLIQFHPSTGIEAIRGDQTAAKECCMIEVKAKEKPAKIAVASGIADGCIRSDSGPIAVFNFAKFAEEELDYLVGAVSNPKKPFAAIVGGSKVSSKIGVIESLLEKVDMLLLGGGMIFTFYKAQGYSVGSSLVEEDKLDLATSLLETAKSKGVVLILPTDVVAADKFAADANSKIVPASSIPDGWMGLDIGPDSIKTFGEALDSTKTVIWNGPMGMFEFGKFAVGTETIVKKLADLSSGKGVTTIIEGSDSVAAVEKVGLADKMRYISTGGGASLELLEGKSLPGVLALDDA